VSFALYFQLSPQSLLINHLHEMSCLLSLPIRFLALSLHWHPEISDLFLGVCPLCRLSMAGTYWTRGLDFWIILFRTSRTTTSGVQRVKRDMA
jgi:hypothetical protein